MVRTLTELYYDNSAILDLVDTGEFGIITKENQKHLTPLMSDLNVYEGGDLFKRDKLMLSRGIGMYLHRQEEYIFARKIALNSRDSLVAWMLDFNQDSLLSFTEKFTLFQDNMAAFHSFDIFPDSLKLPSEEVLPLSIIRMLSEGKIKLWFRVENKKRLELISNYMQNYSYRCIVESNLEYLRLYPFPNALYLIDLENAQNFLSGDLQDRGIDNFLDYNEEILIRIPEFNSFWESLQYFNKRDLQNYTDEQILQLFTVIPFSFFSNYFECGLIERGAPSDFVIFSTEPFSTRSIVEKIVIQGRLVYEK
ncbi:MAG: hypothetical protein KAI81_07960 [Candidatus Marinimicrobia bacterium]|nr:hypothetical protein [Candidatus Neomarinimicrobiota bacterium]